jgi:hypothetical protein
MIGGAKAAVNIRCRPRNPAERNSSRFRGDSTPGSVLRRGRAHRTCVDIRFGSRVYVTARAAWGAGARTARPAGPDEKVARQVVGYVSNVPNTAWFKKVTVTFCAKHPSGRSGKR